MKSYFTIALVAILAIGLGVIVGLNLSYKLDGFFELKLSDLMEIATNMMTAVVVGISIQQLVHKETKKIEVKLEILEGARKQAKSLYDECHRYAMQPDRDKEQTIVRSFKDLSSFLSEIKEFIETGNISFGKVEIARRDFKRAATGDPFGRQQQYSSSELKGIQVSFHRFDKELLSLKIALLGP